MSRAKVSLRDKFSCVGLCVEGSITTERAACSTEYCIHHEGEASDGVSDCFGVLI